MDRNRIGGNGDQKANAIAGHEVTHAAWAASTSVGSCLSCKLPARAPASTAVCSWLRNQLHAAEVHRKSGNSQYDHQQQHYQHQRGTAALIAAHFLRLFKLVMGGSLRM